MRKIWEIKQKIKGEVNIGAIVELLLNNREIISQEQIKDFFNPINPNYLSISDIDVDNNELIRALKRLKKAKNKKEKIIIYGDYDADGITSTAIMWEMLNKLGFDVMPFLPHRENHGYGLKKVGIDAVVEKFGKPDLIITVDNGIVAFEGVEYAIKQGIDVILCDHHEAKNCSAKTSNLIEKKKEKLKCKDEAIYPECSAVIHSTMTAGAGVSYIFAKEINNYFDGTEINADLYELAAIGCITDVVPLKGVSRSIVKFGLTQLRKTSRPGIKSLFAESKIDIDQELNSYHIGYILGPRINATGRLGDSMDSLRLLCTPDPSRAMKLAVDLGEINRERQDMTMNGMTDAIKAVEKNIGNKKIIVVANESYNPGIIGLIAGRLVENFYLPSIVISILDEDEAKGSVRSVKGVNIIEILRKFSELFIDLGGHPLAAGFSIKPENIVILKEKLEEFADKNIDKNLLIPKLRVDTEVNLSDLSFELYDEIKQMAPFGMGNPKPVFVSRNLALKSSKTVGRDGKHVKLTLEEEEDVILDAIFFSAPEIVKKLKSGDQVDVAYQLDLNEWKGRKKLQLMVKDVKNS